MPIEFSPPCREDGAIYSQYRQAIIPYSTLKRRAAESSIKDSPLTPKDLTRTYPYRGENVRLLRIGGAKKGGGSTLIRRPVIVGAFPSG